MHVIASVSRRDRASGLSFWLVEARFDHDVLPRILSIQHATELAIRPYNPADVLDDGALIWRMVDDAEGIDEIEACRFEFLGQLFGVGEHEEALEPERLEASLGDGQARLG